MNKQINILLDRVGNLAGDPSSRSHLSLLIAAIVAGFLIRIYVLFMGQGYHYFAINDEISAYQYALAFLAGEEQAQYLGQPVFSGGQAPGPVWTLFCVMLLKLGNDSLMGALFYLSLINTAVIYLVYRLALKFLKPGYALMTAFLYAISPWPVYYSFGLYNPIPMALWGVILYLALWNVTQQANSRYIFLVCLVAAIAPQFHMIGLFYMPAILLVLFLSQARINKAWFAAGILAGLAVYLPYFIGDAANDWENTRNIFSKSVPGSYGVAKVITTPLSVLSNQTGRWTGSTFTEFRNFGDQYFGSYIVLLILNLVSIGNVLVYMWKFISEFARSFQGRWLPTRQAFVQSPVIVFIGVILFVPSVLFMLTGHNYGSRYAIIILPLLFTLPGLFLQGLEAGEKKRFYTKNLVFIMLSNIYIILAFFSYQADYMKNDEFFSPSFNNLEIVLQELKVHAGPDVSIKIDANDYIKDAPDKRYIAGTCLRNYVDVRETYINHAEPPERKQIYKLVRVTDVEKTDKQIVYQSNGMALIVSPQIR